jgi:transposase
MKPSVIIGVDVSKSTLDIFCKPSGTCVQIANGAAGFKKWLLHLQDVTDCFDNLLVIMEHTGAYSRQLEEFLQLQGIGYCKIAALQIKRSSGVTRGKNDKIDARRIAEYGWLRREILVAQEGAQPELEQLQSLLSLRKKMVRDRAGYKARLKEMLGTGSCSTASLEAKVQQGIIKEFSRAIVQFEQQIKAIIQSHEALSRTHELLKSIKGVGWLVAASMICYTANFKKFANARKFNCYAGVAPFKHQSGTSIRGRSRVSHLANKEVKTLLNLAAFSALRYDKELKTYYERRLAEGKGKMSCVNIIRAKIISRMFAVVKRQTPYYQLAA